MQPDQDRPSYYADRRDERIPVDSAARLHRPNWYSVEVRVHDVSQCGFMAECIDPVQIGSFVTLDVPGIGSVDAQVRWQIGGRMGGMFLDPISLHQCEWTATKAEPPKEVA